MATVNARDAGIAVNGSFTAAIDFVAQLLAANVIEVDNDLVGDATVLVTELATSFTKARLALAAEIVADYPDAPKGGGGGGGGGYRKSGGGGGGKPSTTSTDPASDKQVKFISDLNESKGQSFPTEGITKADAAKSIEALLAMADAN